MKKIGIYGGSFNPVHNEHVKIAQAIIQELNLDILYIIPTFIAPHKLGENVESGEDRFNMLKIAFDGVEKVVVSDYELKKGGVSFSYLTVEHFKNLHQDSQIFFLVGSDMLENFPTWKNPEKILLNCNLVLVQRLGENFDNDKLIKKVENLYNTKIVKLFYVGQNLSSTEVRLRLYLGLDVDNLIDKKVLDYIRKNDCYLGNKYYKFVNSKLPNKRKNHILGVILTAKNLALKLGADVKKAELSALLHDIAKYEDYKNYPNFEMPSSVSKDIEHQFLGAYICEKVLGIDDEEIINAIKYHTTGKGNMTLLEKIIYVVDIIEPSRTFIGVDELRKLVENDFESGFIACLNEILDFLNKSNISVYPLTLEAVNYYKKEK